MSSDIVKACAKFVHVNTYNDLKIIHRVFVSCLRKSYPSDSVNISSNVGRLIVIKIPSEEANHVANCIEMNMSLMTTFMLINKHQLLDGRRYLSRSSIRSCIARMKPRVVSVEVKKQGSSDPLSSWAIARNNWVFQFLLRFIIKT